MHVYGVHCGQLLLHALQALRCLSRFFFFSSHLRSFSCWCLFFLRYSFARHQSIQMCIFVDWNYIPRYRLIFPSEQTSFPLPLPHIRMWEFSFGTFRTYKIIFNRQTEKAHDWLENHEWLSHMQSGCSNFKYSFYIYLLLFFPSRIHFFFRLQVVETFAW